MRTLVRYGIMTIAAFLAVALLTAAISYIRVSDTAHAGAPTCTWTGGGADTNFSTAGNWTCEEGSVPDDGTAIVFPTGLSNRIANNDLSSALVFSGITFSGSCVSFSDDVYFITGLVPLAGDITDETTVTGDGSTCVSNSGIRSLELHSDATISSGDPINMGLAFGCGSSSGTEPSEGCGIDISTYTLNISSLDRLSLNPMGDDATTATLAGSGIINVTNADLIMMVGSDNSSFSGTINTGSSARLMVRSTDNTAMSTTLGTATLNINDGSVLRIESDDYLGTITIPNDLNLSGAGSSGTRKIEVYSGGQLQDNSFSSVISPSANALYFERAPQVNVTLSGDIVLAADASVGGNINTLSLTGGLSGSYTITNNEPTYYSMCITVNGSTNTTSTSNGDICPSVVLSYSISFGSNEDFYVGYLHRLIVNNTQGDILLRYGGILSGNGTVGAVTSEGGTVAPGNSPEVLDTGDLDFDSDTTLEEEIGGTTTGEYDQLNVTGTVSLGGATLTTTHYNSFIPSVDDTFTIINNDGADAVTGTFNGLAEAATFLVDDVTYSISYVGGDGNDVVLTVTSSPSAPNTSGVLAQPANIAIALGVVVSGLGLLMVRNKFIKAKTKTAKR